MLKAAGTVARSLTHVRPLSVSSKLNAGHADIMEKWPRKWSSYLLGFYLAASLIQGTI
jgi:hypothetical protein